MKKLQTKLVLDRETVATLQSGALDLARGGNCVTCTRSRPPDGPISTAITIHTKQVTCNVSWAGR